MKCGGDFGDFAFDAKISYRQFVLRIFTSESTITV